MDSIPANVQYGYNLMYIVYDRTQDKASFNAPNRPYYAYLPPPNVPDIYYTGFSGTICNFPDFAKKWNIPPTGIPIEYKGEFDETTLPPFHYPYHAVGNLVLTILK